MDFKMVERSEKYLYLYVTKYTHGWALFTCLKNFFSSTSKWHPPSHRLVQFMCVKLASWEQNVQARRAIVEQYVSFRSQNKWKLLMQYRYDESVENDGTAIPGLKISFSSEQER